MLDRRSGPMITVAIAAAAFGAVIASSISQTLGQAGATRPARIEGKPNFSGIWQANNEANCDLPAHAALPLRLGYIQDGLGPRRARALVHRGSARSGRRTRRR